MIRYILLSLVFIMFSGFTPTDIDYKHKKINKEINKTFKVIMTDDPTIFCAALSKWRSTDHAKQ